MNDEFVKPLRILHLEDNSNDAQLLLAMLEEECVPCAINRVDTREEFTRALETAEIDLIVSDYALPAFDGNSALTIARRLCPEVPFICLSGTIGEDAAVQMLLSGATDYIIKNNLKRLVPSVRRAIQEAEQKKVLRKAEEEKKKLEDQIRQSQKMESVGRLAGGIAHDFNNLLTVIIGGSNMLEKSLSGNPSAMEDLDEIRNAAKRAAVLTRQLLAFSRKQIFSPKVINVNSIVDNMQKMLSRVIGEDISLEMRLDPNLGQIEADPPQVEQVLMNLVVNARDAMPQGGKLRLETKNVDLDETYHSRHFEIKPGPHVMVLVSDTGVGMNEETKERIFEPFFTTKEQGKGTGLGLATVYGIIKQSQGDIWIYSEPGQGTTFKINFPRVRSKLSAVESPAIPANSLAGLETILLVEDDDSVRRLARKILQLQGYKVMEASHGVEALSICEKYQEPIHLVLTDTIMPKMNGRELVERLVSLLPKIKAVFMSGYTDTAIVEKGILKEKIEFIEKPFSLETLAQKIREVLDK